MTRTETRLPSNLPASRAGASIRRLWLGLAAAVLLFGAVATWNAFADRNLPEEVADSRVISAQELADHYGIEIRLVGVTAAGGLIDMRFTITDATKAEQLFTDSHTMPALLAEPSGVVIRAPSGHRHSEIKPVDGGKYFILYPNPGGVIQSGVPVSVIINGVRVEHVIAVS